MLLLWEPVIFLSDETNISFYEKFQTYLSSEFLKTEVDRLKNENKQLQNDKHEMAVKLQELNAIESQNLELTQKMTLLESALQHYKNELENKCYLLCEERNFALLSSQNINELSKRVSLHIILISPIKMAANLPRTKNL